MQRSNKKLFLRILSAMLALVVMALLGAWLYVRASLPLLEGIVQSPNLHAAVTVGRDALGVPLISGANRDDIAYATGFVHAQERFFQMDLLRRVGAGELAELFGARSLNVDKLRRVHRFRARAALALAAMTVEERRFIDRYVAGVNHGINALDAYPFEYRLVGARPRPWQAADSLLVVCAMYFDLQGNLLPRELARGWLRDNTTAEQLAFLLPESSQWDATLDEGDLVLPSAPIPARAPAWWGKLKRAGVATVASANGSDAVGSNNAAIAGSRSKGGAAIISNDMHLGLQLPNIWYRLAFQLTGAVGQARRTVGVTLPGAPPVVIVGSNGRVAWGFTNSYGDYLDLVALETDSARSGQVRTPAGWETPVVHAETILVKGEPAVKLLVRETSFGPIREASGTSYALHWLAHRPGALNLNHKRLESADTLDAALEIANTLGIPQQNFVAGDDRGNIGWTIAGMLPQRAQPGIGATFPIALDGAQSTFAGSLALSAYPRLINPSNGQLSSANSRQLGAAGTLLIGDGGFDLGARHRQLRDGLLALGAKTDVGGAYSVMLDDRALFMDAWRGRAIKVLDAAALEGKPQRAQFLALLRSGWSGRASVESAGYRLVRQFMWSIHDQLYEGANGEVALLDEKATMALANARWTAVLGRLLDEQPAGWLPAGYASWRELQLGAVDRAIVELTKDGATLAEATWGKRNTAAIAHPIAVGLPVLRHWLSAPADQLAGDANMPRVAGSKMGQSQRMTVTPGKEEQGIFNMPGGQSGHPLSPYFLGGHADWVAGARTPLLPGAVRHTLVFKR